MRELKTNPMKLIEEFKKFAMRGNVVDMAVGIIIGGAFGKIVSSFVSDVIMPPLGLLIGGVNFTDLIITLKGEMLDTAGTVVNPAVTINYGAFLQVIFDFLIIALCIFAIIKILSSVKKKEVEKPAPAPIVDPVVELLSEIRDELRKKS